ncbi:MAG: molybdate transport system ATP-binding protein [Oleispira sp.]|jgi:molybdate transport system ATP-binding protein
MDNTNTLSIALRWSRKAFNLDIELTMPAQGVTAIYGASGSGKTSVLRCIAGLEKVENCELSFRDQVWQDGKTFVPTNQRGIGYVFQEASLFPHLTADANLRYALKRARPGKVLTTFADVVELLGLRTLLDQYPDQLSGGERQRVAIARALLINPQLLLMDEPLASLDHQRKQELLPYLERICYQLNVPVIYISHSLWEVSLLADHIVMLDAGRVTKSENFLEAINKPDFPISQQESISSLLQCKVMEHNQNWGLTRFTLKGMDKQEIDKQEVAESLAEKKVQPHSLWLQQCDLAPGQEVRLNILASDVSLSLSHHEDTSISNILPVTIMSMESLPHGLLMLQLQLGDAILRAKLTQRSVDRLALTIGQKVWAQVKSAALIQ